MEATLDAGLKNDAMGLLVRQPIFQRDRSVWAYELFSDKPWTYADEGLSSFKEVICNLLEKLSLLSVDAREKKKLFLTIEDKSVLENMDLSQLSEQCVFGVSGDTACSPVGSGFMDRAHACGGSVALECDCISPEDLMGKCDIIKVSLAGKTPADIVCIRNKYKGFGGKLLATDVADWEAFEGTKALGFDYFQGPFFAEPRLAKNPRLQPSVVSKLQLLRELNAPGCEVAELSDIIASDVSLSYRILQYINSAAFGLKNRITSIQQAVSLLGLNELKQWVTVVVMADMDSSPAGEELAYMALQRARFLSGLASSVRDFRQSPETMFMLGLFSKLDAMLSFPMEEALADIPLAEELKEGLCGGDNEFGDCLRMLAAVEQADWQAANSIFGRYGVCITEAATEYLRASKWAAKQLPNMP